VSLSSTSFIRPKGKKEKTGQCSQKGKRRKRKDSIRIFLGEKERSTKASEEEKSVPLFPILKRRKKRSLRSGALEGGSPIPFTVRSLSSFLKVPGGENDGRAARLPALKMERSRLDRGKRRHHLVNAWAKRKARPSLHSSHRNATGR